MKTILCWKWLSESHRTLEKTEKYRLDHDYCFCALHGVHGLGDVVIDCYYDRKGKATLNTDTTSIQGTK